MADSCLSCSGFGTTISLLAQAAYSRLRLFSQRACLLFLGHLRPLAPPLTARLSPLFVFYDYKPLQTAPNTRDFIMASSQRPLPAQCFVFNNDKQCFPAKIN